MMTCAESEVKKENTNQDIKRVNCLFHKTLYGQNQSYNSTLFNLLGHNIQSLKKLSQQQLKKDNDDHSSLLMMSQISSLEVQLGFYLDNSPIENTPNLSAKDFSKSKLPPSQKEQLNKILNTNWDSLDESSKESLLKELISLISKDGQYIYNDRENKISLLFEKILNADNELALSIFENLSIDQKRSLLIMPNSIRYKNKSNMTLAGLFKESFSYILEIDPREDLSSSLEFFKSKKSNVFERNYSAKTIADDILLRDGELIRKYVSELPDHEKNELSESKLLNSVLPYIDDPFDHKHLLKDPQYPFKGKNELRNYLRNHIKSMLIP